MYPMQTVIITCIASHITIALLFLSVRSIPQHQGTDWWLGSSLMLITSYIFLFIAIGDGPDLSIDLNLSSAGKIGIYFMNMACMLFLYIGSTAFLQQALQLKNYAAAFLSLFAVLTYLKLNTDDTLLADILFSSYCSICIYLTARQHYKQTGEAKQIRHILAKLCFFSSLHWLSYPFVHNLNEIAPFSFLIGVTTSACVFTLLAMMIIMRFKERLIISEQRAVYASKHDVLTGLYNRYSLDQLFKNYTQWSTDNNRPFAILYIDLDGFKAVNDTYGHKAGDQVLSIVAKRLQGSLSNIGKVARIGGDEFIILSEQVGTEDKALTETFINNLLLRIEHPIVQNDQTYHVSASIGISLYPKHGDRLDLLLNKADEAMYQAKKAGKNRHAYADDEEKPTQLYRRKTDLQQILASSSSKDNSKEDQPPQLAVTSEED